MKYEVACSCGKILPVSVGMAGSSIACTCGRIVLIPPLSQFRSLSVTELPTDSADSSQSWQADQPEPMEEFRRALALVTPRVFVTWLLLGINVLVFLLMMASGVSPSNPSVPDLLRWGADFGPKTMDGEWWRLLTCMFVHIGVLHLVLNMVCLAVAGPIVERMFGNVGFLLVYIVAGLFGSLVSLLWNPMLVSAGASGAIFGIYGALLGQLLRQRNSIPAAALKQLQSSGVGFLVINLIFGLTQSNIDSAAHIGGLVGGFLGGLVLSQPITTGAIAGRRIRNLLLSGLGVALLISGIIGIQGFYASIPKAQSELERFQVVEESALRVYNAAIAKAQRQELTDPAFVEILEREVLPEWKASRERLAALTQLPASLDRHVASILEYMRLREEGWESFTQALREGNPQKAQQAMDKQALADAAAKRLTDKADK